MIRGEFRFAVLGEREIESVISNSEVGRDGLRIVTRGIDTTQYMASSPVLLFQHDPTEPIGRCMNLRIAGDDLTTSTSRPPHRERSEAITPVEHGCCGAMSAGEITGIGFDPVTAFFAPDN